MLNSIKQYPIIKNPRVTTEIVRYHQTIYQLHFIYLAAMWMNKTTYKYIQSIHMVSQKKLEYLSITPTYETYTM